MNRGQVYGWDSDRGSVTLETVVLDRLESGLKGRFVEVRNGGEINLPNPIKRFPLATKIENAQPNEDGDYIFDPCRGGRRIDRFVVAGRIARASYVESSHFGEVNSYYHLDLCAAYADDLLREIGHPSIPRVVAVVNAHGSTIDHAGFRDGAYRKDKWFPFQGAHYRVPGKCVTIREHNPISPDGEIHLGPGRRLTKGGALHDFFGGAYRANASHNSGILYHEYGHHLTNHLADFKANRLRPAERRSNVKVAIDEGYCDYWTATMMRTPSIWSLHHPRGDSRKHPRSLANHRTMASFDASPDADPHWNGTIWSGALWDLRDAMADPRACDLLVLKSLCILGSIGSEGRPGQASRLRSSYETGLVALLEAEQSLFGGCYSSIVESMFCRRGIEVPTRSAKVAA